MRILGNKETRLVLGGVPRVDLLPPEVGLSAKARVLHRGLSLMVVAAMVVVGAGYAAASLNAANSNAQLATATARTQSLLAQQQKYVEVRKVTKELALTTAGRQVGSSTEINWQEYFNSVQASLPSGTTIVTFDSSSSTPMLALQQPTVPLQGERVAELSFEAETASLPDVPAWLNALAKLKGFVDASPNSVSLTDGVYKVGVKMHVNEQALANRYASDAVKSPEKNNDSANTAPSDTATEASKDGGK
ncbi:hypothetical protein GCM10027052_00110 [Parafrigoribacterium mesophilum]|uniref:hypothetical protein n=1 Tax=Parafrigoribacterium mesophilum TaxID=433646 RepID=UPI0031FE39EF